MLVGTDSFYHWSVAALRILKRDPRERIARWSKEPKESPAEIYVSRQIGTLLSPRLLTDVRSGKSWHTMRIRQLRGTTNLGFNGTSKMTVFVVGGIAFIMLLPHCLIVCLHDKGFVD